MAKVTVAPAAVTPSPDILALRIADARFDHYPMITALTQLREQISQQSGGKIVFDYNYSLPISVQRKYADRYTSVEQWWKKARNPKIDVRLHDTTFAALLDEMCRQSGWVYTTKGRVGISFVDRASPELERTTR